ncbi:uncharacterized protein C2orf15 homolog isoform X1 [Ursus arctos]|nr:uncharacterized protein C2orf15 homolog isoform X1 [Ursus arctos]
MILIEFAPLYFKSNFIFEETNNSCFCQDFFLNGNLNASPKRPQIHLFSLHVLKIPDKLRDLSSKKLLWPRSKSNQVEETFPLLKEVPANYIYSTIPMGFSLSKSATQVSALHMDSKVDDHLMQGTEKTKLEPVTQLFQNTKKIRLEDTNQEHFTRSKEIGSGTLSEKTLGSVVYVKESDGIEMTDVE